MVLVAIVVWGAPWLATEKMERRESVPHIKLTSYELR